MNLRQPIDLPHLDTDGIQFHPVIDLPDGYEVYDFSRGYDPNRERSSLYGIGRYNEYRPSMYSAPQYAVDEIRNIHMGIDIAAPVGDPVRAFYHGSIYLFGDNTAHQDYGPTIITKHRLLDQDLYALHGHLSRASISDLQSGQTFKAGDTIGYIGDETENGGWNPHIHFQLCRLAPATHDLPGVVSAAQHAAALTIFPDPRLVLGPIYED